MQQAESLARLQVLQREIESQERELVRMEEEAARRKQQQSEDTEEVRRIRSSGQDSM